MYFQHLCIALMTCFLVSFLLGWNQHTNRRLVWILWSDLHGSLVVLPKVEVQRIHQEMSSRLEDSKLFYLKHTLADECCAIKESFCSKRHPFLKFRCLNNSATPPQTTWYSDFVWFSCFVTLKSVPLPTNCLPKQTVATLQVSSNIATTHTT